MIKASANCPPVLSTASPGLRLLELYLKNDTLTAHEFVYNGLTPVIHTTTVNMDDVVGARFDDKTKELIVVAYPSMPVRVNAQRIGLL